MRELFALSVDYDKSDRTSQQVFAAVQNLLLYAVTGQTAAELVSARANPSAPNFGLLAWRGDMLRDELRNKKKSKR